MSDDRVDDVEEWNNGTTGEVMRRLRHRLDDHPAVEDVDLKPGGALDAMRIELVQNSGTVPQSIASAIYDRGLAIRSVRGYKSVTVSAPERRGIEVDDDVARSSREGPETTDRVDDEEADRE